MLTAGMVCDRTNALAHEITEAYRGRTPHLLCVLKGASIFYMKLIDMLHQAAARLGSPAHAVPFTFDFIRVKSYEGTESSGHVRIDGVEPAKLAGRHVIVVEDIIDTGLSMRSLLPMLREHAASVEVCTLLEKRTSRSCGLRARYTGFSIPDHFVIGFGLDYDEAFRDLEHICVINHTGIERFRDFGASLAESKA